MNDVPIAKKEKILAAGCISRRNLAYGSAEKGNIGRAA